VNGVGVEIEVHETAGAARLEDLVEHKGALPERRRDCKVERLTVGNNDIVGEDEAIAGRGGVVIGEHTNGAGDNIDVKKSK
jgi:hypothetical protein